MTNTAAFEGAAPAASATRWLALAAAPTFALMAAWTAYHGETSVVCGMSPSPLGGMTLMYLLMSAFHCPPWLRLLGEAARR